MKQKLKTKVRKKKKFKTLLGESCCDSFNCPSAS